MINSNKIREKISQFMHSTGHCVHFTCMSGEDLSETKKWFEDCLADEVCQISNELIRDIAEHVSNYFPNEESKSSTVVRDIVLKIILNYSL